MGDFGIFLARVVGGLLLLGTGAYAAYWIVAMWPGTTGLWSALCKGLLCPVLVVVALVTMDSGLGLVNQAFADDTPQTVLIEPAAAAPNHLYLIFHGFNSSGYWLAQTLAPMKVHGRLVGFESGEDGFNNDKIVAAALQAIDTYHPDKVYAYVESGGGMTLATLLRARPSLVIEEAVLNAAISGGSDLDKRGVLGSFTPLPGGPIATKILRFVAPLLAPTSPSPDASANLEVMRNAEQAGHRISGPTAFGELRMMINTQPVLPDEFAGRIRRARYLHAPGPNDGFVNTAQASNSWRLGIGLGRFTDTPVGEWQSDDGNPLHCPIERPGPVFAAIARAAA